MPTCENVKMFQSAPPVKGATVAPGRMRSHRGVSIRAPREGGDAHHRRHRPGQKVSIRAPREGGDGGSLQCLVF